MISMSKIAENESICFDIYGNFFFHLIVRRLKFTIYIKLNVRFLFLSQYFKSGYAIATV